MTIGKAGMFSRRIDSDPHWSNVSLLMHFDGTSFTDSSLNAHPITLVGSASLTTDNPKFGARTGLFTGGHLEIPNSTTFGFGTGDFTIEMWVYPTTEKLVAGLVSVGFYNEGILWRHGTNFDNLYINAFPGSYNIDWNPEINAPITTWTHIALVRSGSDVTVYAGGTSVATGTSSADLLSTQPVTIGASSHSKFIADEQYDGRIDELRITKGVARYTAAFTPPATPFPDG